MATKNISITEDAYNLLLKRKLRESESFSQVIERVVRINDFDNLRKLHGILKGKAGEELEKRIVEGRKKHAKLHKERIKKLKEQWRR